MKKSTSWEHVGDWYDDLLRDEDTYQNKVILPNVVRLAALKNGMKVLDLACGQGFFSRAFADAGAAVVGTDISAKLIAIAKKNVSNAKFFVSPAHRLEMIQEHSLDAATIILAAQNIENISEVFKEIQKKLKPGGKLLLVLNHPAFRNPGASSWGFDEQAKKQYRRIDAYMTESKREIDMHPGSQKKITTVSFHRPLQVYFKTLANAGFQISRLEEWVSHRESEKGPRKEEEDRTRREFPLFLCIEAKSITER
ncbi:MAG: class I SAM-dependent methyltransferase [Candidatus Pacebacteria bacterium]|jgi:ubiquinone/menaquinone biosynthesis C-methylase UbiE|nr:class I SAM-dependent methyltransferase [Candidatus Paceibacterota bacterium]